MFEPSKQKGSFDRCCPCIAVRKYRVDSTTLRKYNLPSLQRFWTDLTPDVPFVASALNGNDRQKETGDGGEQRFKRRPVSFPERNKKEENENENH